MVLTLVAPSLNFAGLRGEDTMRISWGVGGGGTARGRGGSICSPNPDPIEDQSMDNSQNTIFRH